MRDARGRSALTDAFWPSPKSIFHDTTFGGTFSTVVNVTFSGTFPEVGFALMLRTGGVPSPKSSDHSTGFGTLVRWAEPSVAGTACRWT
jgi:hypothetical protein